MAQHTIRKSYLAAYLVGCMVSCFVLTCVNTAHAQYSTKSPKKPRRKTMNFEATLHSFNATHLNVVAENDHPWVVAIDEKTLVTVRGEAGDRLLKVGAFVRFVVYLDKKNKATQPARMLTVFSPRPGFKPGMTSDAVTMHRAGFALPPVEIEKAAEIKKLEQLKKDSLESDLQQTKKNGAKKDSLDAQPAEPDTAKEEPLVMADPFSEPKTNEDSKRHLVEGVIKKFRNHQLYISIGKSGNLRIPVDPQALVYADLRNHQFARTGDQIHVHGHYYYPGKGVADKLEITLARHAVKKKRRPNRKARPKVNRKKEAAPKKQR